MNNLNDPNNNLDEMKDSVFKNLFREIKSKTVNGDGAQN